jgi:hypothetical protein
LISDLEQGVGSTAYGELGDKHPADIALPVSFVSHGDYGAVGPEPHCMTVASSDLCDIPPPIDIALSITIISHGNYGAVGFNPRRVLLTCRDLNDIPPAANIALPMGVVSHGDYPAFF